MLILNVGACYVYFTFAKLVVVMNLSQWVKNTNLCDAVLNSTLVGLVTKTKQTYNNWNLASSFSLNSIFVYLSVFVNTVLVYDYMYCFNTTYIPSICFIIWKWIILYYLFYYPTCFLKSFKSFYLSIMNFVIRLNLNLTVIRSNYSLFALTVPCSSD